MNRSSKIKLSKAAIITISFGLIGILISAYDYFYFLSINSSNPGLEYSFIKYGVFNILAGFMGGIFASIFLVYYINEVYSDKPYGFLIVAVSLSFIVIVSLLMILIGLIIVPVSTGKPLTDPITLKAFKEYLLDPLHAKNMVAWSGIVALTQFFMQVNNKFGHGVLRDFINGKYHEPREEQRIFMFLDINSSTTLAEQLGHNLYHHLLRDFFADITNPILNSYGEIYQYAGDEVIVSWKEVAGLSDGRCIRCFFDIKGKIRLEAEKYKSKYGLVPTFKAGIHIGSVTAGEVGILKRDITFSGDTLNTTSRIQSQCKELKVEVLISDLLLGKLSLPEDFIHQSKGSIKLRGKEKEIGLSTIQSRINDIQNAQAC